MATLPDVDTANTGFIAFWNAIDDGGVGSIDPSEALSDTGLASYTLYDNGFEGVYNLNHLTRDVQQNVNVRVKTDGWIIAYTGRTNDFQQNTNTPPVGYWDLANDWTDLTSTAEIQSNLLERAINSLRSELSNSDSMNYSSDDVGLYNYEFTDATTVTLLSGHDKVGNAEGPTSNPDYAITSSYGFVYTTGTTRHYHAAVGTQNTGEGLNGETHHSRTLFEGTTVSDTAQGDYGAYDVLEGGAAPNAGTEYTQSIELGGADDEYAQQADGSVSNFIIWS